MKIPLDILLQLKGVKQIKVLSFNLLRVYMSAWCFPKRISAATVDECSPIMWAYTIKLFSINK